VLDCSIWLVGSHPKQVFLCHQDVSKSLKTLPGHRRSKAVGLVVVQMVDEPNYPFDIVLVALKEVVRIVLSLRTQKSLKHTLEPRM
jgi:hypothetical protein